MNKRDKGDFFKTAKRETEEELKPLKWGKDFDLAPLTRKIVYGPKWSKSAKENIHYSIQFFHLHLKRPLSILERIVERNRFAVFMPEDRIRVNSKVKIAAPVMIARKKLRRDFSLLPSSLVPLFKRKLVPNS